jgi:hypothetical protein
MPFRTALPLVILGALFWTPAARATDVLTYHNDNGRTGQNLSEVILTPSNVNFTTFGRLFTLSVDGRVDAQTLYASGAVLPGPAAHNLLIVATEHDTVYAFDADTGAQLWHVSMLKPGETPSDDRGCGQVSPEIGVTATPVIDRQAGPNGTIYVVAMSKDSSNNYFQRLHALDLTTGAEQPASPIDVHAFFQGTGGNSSNGTLSFDPKQYKERPGLLLLNGVIYTMWSSHCDIQPYTAWVIAYNQFTLKRTSVLNLTPNGHEASMWQAGAGPAADAGGNIYFLLANGTFDTNLNGAGFPSQGDYGNAFMKLSSGNLAVADYFTMFDTVSESNADADLGSGGALVLPDLLDAQSHVRHLAVGAGKDARIYVVDRDNMGKFNASNDNQIYQQLSSTLGGGVFSMPAFFNGTLYYGAVGDTLKAIPFSNGLFASTASSHSATGFGYPGTTPGISANGVTNGIVWAAENSSPAVLHAYNAGNLAVELYNSNQAPNSRDHFGAGNKFITPTIADGKVYVGTTNGVGVFGLLSLPGAVKPVITSPTSAAAVMGTPFVYQITASNNPTSYGASGFPAGWAFDSTSGVLAGTPSSVGATNVFISASNAGGTGIGNVNITVTDPCIPTLTPGIRQFTSSGGSDNATVTIDSGCNWSPATVSNWIALSGSGMGGGIFGYAVSANSGPARTGTISVGSQSFTIMQGASVQTFNDVPPGAFSDYISLLSSNGITAGCSASPPLYCPDTPVTRDQMAVFVVSALDHINHAAGTVPANYTQAPAYFQDETIADPFYAFVQRLADFTITNGCQASPPLYCPTQTITQGQMAKFMILGWLKTQNLATFSYTTTPYFTDVPPTDIFFSYVQKMRDLGFWTGCGATLYCESSPVTRAQMAPMVMRALLGAP